MTETVNQQPAPVQPAPAPRPKRRALFIALGALAAIAIIAIVAERIIMGGDFVSGSESAFASLARSYCGLRGGQMVSTGCGIANCRETCLISLPDAGRPCASSKDCSGRCLAENITGIAAQMGAGVYSPPTGCTKQGTDYQCGADLRGQCASFRRLPNCQSNYELLGGGLIRPVSDGCAL